MSRSLADPASHRLDEGTVGRLSGRAPLGRRQLASTATLSITMIGVSAANYGLNLVLARVLPPAQFGDANLAINLVLASAAIAATLQLVTARAVAADPASAEATRRRLLAWAWTIGGLAGVAMVAGAGPLSGALQTSTPAIFVVIGIGLPVYIAQAVLRGSLQGELRIGRLAVSYAAEAGARVGLALLLLALGFGVTGAAVAISLSFVVSALVARHRDNGVPVAGDPEAAGAAGPSLAAVSVAATVLLVGQVVIANGDVVLAKATLLPEAAGGYAAAALLGRALFFLSWSVVHATFPLVARAGTDAAARRRAFRRALAMILAACVTGVVAMAVLGRPLAPVLLGSRYADAVDVLVPYAVATSLFAVANLVATVDLAAGRRAGPAALLLGAALQTTLLLTWGSTPMSMARTQVAAMAVTLALVTVAHLRAERSAELGPLPTPEAGEAAARRRPDAPHPAVTSRRSTP